MKPAYSDILLKPGAVTHGIVSVKVVPREWLAADPVIDFNTGKVITAVSLAAGRSWILLDFAATTYKYDEKPKSTRSGSFYEISLSGSINNYDSAMQQVMDSLRYHELMAIVLDRNKRIKLAGTRDAGFGVSPANNVYSAHIEMVMESEFPAPFYDL